MDQLTTQSPIEGRRSTLGIAGPNALHCATIFLSAFLLFSIQPIVGRRLLPWFGGAASVWSACMLFFQVMLLLGYLYADRLTRLANRRKQVWIHTILLAAGALLLPIKLSEKIAGSLAPPLRIAAILALGVGIPYFLLSTTSPLVQVWSSRVTGRAPYRLYALSNTASLLALVLYPVVIEPYVTSNGQLLTWSVAFAGFVILCAASAILTGSGTEAASSIGAQPAAAPVPPSAILLWLVFSSVPIALLLATTNHLCQNVAAIPFLWIVPLVTYLLTLILCFDYQSRRRHQLFLWLAPCALIVMGYACLHSTFRTDPRLLIPLFTAGLFIVCMWFHGELVNRKPDPASLTSFYLTISFGGALGAALIVWLAPIALTSVFELPYLLAVSAVFLLFLNYRKKWYTDLVFVATAIIVIVFAWSETVAFTEGTRIALRNFYGAIRTLDVRRNGNGPLLRTMVHGTVSHGSQFLDPSKRETPTTYYARGTGVQIALEELRKGPQSVGLIGLGAGTLAAYAKPEDHFVFYELNPQVVDLARREFTYLSKSNVEVVVGDGRLALQKDPRRFDTLVLDAFSGDAIPTHLLTREALGIYLEHLNPNGLIAVHITNSVVDLEPAVEKLAQSANLAAALVYNRPYAETDRYEAAWVLMTNSPDQLKAPALVTVARPLRAKPGQRLWTDDYSNLFQLLKTR